MQQSPSWETNWFLQLVKKFPAFLEPESSSPYSQVPAICPYPDPTPYSPHNPLPLPEDPSYYYPPICVWVYPMVSFPQVSPPEPCTPLSAHQTRQTKLFSWYFLIYLSPVVLSLNFFASNSWGHLWMNINKNDIRSRQCYNKLMIQVFATGIRKSHELTDFISLQLNWLYISDERWFNMIYCRYSAITLMVLCQLMNSVWH